MATDGVSSFGGGASGDRRAPRDGRGREVRQSLERLFDRLPPHSPEAEMSLLGSMLLDPGVIADVIRLAPDDSAFYAPAHQAVYRAILENYDKHRSIDLVQLHEALRDRGQIEDVGGPDYLVRLAEAVPSAVNAPHYARIVSEKAKLRRLIDAAGQILFDAYHAGDASGDGVQSIVDAAEQRVFEIAQEQEVADPQQLAHLLQLEIERLEAMEGKGISGVPTGYDDLDALLSGLQPGELIIVAARPSMGKTALALNIAEQIAMGGIAPGAHAPKHARVPVGVFSLEMSKSSVARRMLSARSRIDAHRMRSGRFSDDEFKRLIYACGELGEAPIVIDDTPGLSVFGLRARARRMVAQHAVGALMIDYLQLLSSPAQARESRQVEVSAISRGIKALARELNIPVICLAQLNRGAEQREGNRPRMSDLRESGSIEQDADVVVLLHREEYYHRDDENWAYENPDKVGLAELIIAKQRNGPTGVVKLLWDEAITRFKNLAQGQTPHAHAAPHAPHAARSAQQAETKPARVGFAPGPKSGPAQHHRDGGGPDAALDDLPI